MTNFSRTADAGPSPLALYDRDEDGFPCYGGLPNDGDARCGSCGALCGEVVRCTWDAALMVGACCAVAEPDYFAIAVDGARKAAARVAAAFAADHAAAAAEAHLCECRPEYGNARGCPIHDSFVRLHPELANSRKAAALVAAKPVASELVYGNDFRFWRVYADGRRELV